MLSVCRTHLRGAAAGAIVHTLISRWPRSPHGGADEWALFPVVAMLGGGGMAALLGRCACPAGQKPSGITPSKHVTVFGRWRPEVRAARGASGDPCASPSDVDHWGTAPGESECRPLWK